MGKATAHGIKGGLISFVQGGKFEQGFFSGAASSLSGNINVGSSLGAQVALGAVVGGTVEEIGGGKFANGAVTGSFTVLFNALMHQIDISKVNRAIADFMDLGRNGRMYNSEEEATRIAQYIVATIGKEIEVSTYFNSSGEKSYYLESFFPNNWQVSRLYNNDRLEAEGYTLVSGTHYSISEHLQPNGKVGSVAVSRADFEAARHYGVPITHFSVGLGQWTITHDYLRYYCRYTSADIRYYPDAQFNISNVHGNP